MNIDRMPGTRVMDNAPGNMGGDIDPYDFQFRYGTVKGTAAFSQLVTVYWDDGVEAEVLPSTLVTANEEFFPQDGISGDCTVDRVLISDDGVVIHLKDPDPSCHNTYETEVAISREALEGMAEQIHRRLKDR